MYQTKSRQTDPPRPSRTHTALSHLPHRLNEKQHSHTARRPSHLVTHIRIELQTTLTHSHTHTAQQQPLFFSFPGIRLDRQCIRYKCYRLCRLSRQCRFRNRLKGLLYVDGLFGASLVVGEVAFAAAPLFCFLCADLSSIGEVCFCCRVRRMGMSAGWTGWRVRGIRPSSCRASRTTWRR